MIKMVKMHGFEAYGKGSVHDIHMPKGYEMLGLTIKTSEDVAPTKMPRLISQIQVLVNFQIVLQVETKEIWNLQKLMPFNCPFQLRRGQIGINFCDSAVDRCFNTMRDVTVRIQSEQEFKADLYGCFRA